MDKEHNIKQFIETQIPNMDSPEKVYQLFAGLGYKTLDPSYKGKEAWGLKEKDKESVKEIYAVANYEKRFQILLVELKHPSASILKTLPLDLEKEISYPFFVFTPDYQNYTFVLVEKIREDVGVWKRKLVKLNLDRMNAYYTDKWIISKIAIEDEEGVPIPLIPATHSDPWRPPRSERSDAGILRYFTDSLPFVKFLFSSHGTSFQ